MNASKPALPRFFSPPEIADSLGIDPAKVISWIRSGRLRAVNVSEGARRARWKVSPEALAAFFTSREPNAPTPRPKRRRRDPAEVDYLADIS